MPNFRRVFWPGGTFFFTVVTHQRQPLLAHLGAIEALRAAVRDARHSQPFTIDAWVVLPDHMHAVWTLPPGDSDYPTRWRRIKAGFSRRIGAAPCRSEPSTQGRDRERRSPIWQRRYWEHLIRDEDDFSSHINYVHFNPVKHELVTCPKNWPYSTFHRYVNLGLYPPDWGSDDVTFPDFVGRE